MRRFSAVVGVHKRRIGGHGLTAYSAQALECGAVGDDEAWLQAA